MSRAGSFARAFKNAVKTVALIMLQVIKFALYHLIRLIAQLWDAVNKRLRFSITFKITVTYTLIFSVILILLSLLMTGSFAAFLIYETERSLQKDSLYVAELIKASHELPTDKLNKWADLEEVDITLYDEQSHLIFSTAAKNSLPISLGRIRLSPASTLDERFHYERLTKLNNGVRKIELAKPLYEKTLYLAALVTFLCAAFLLAIILSAIIGSRASRKMLKPIDDMTRTVRSISAGDLSTRLDLVDSHDELKDLALTFNEMLDRIQISFEQQNVFVSNASHELRTPIAVIQGYANLLQRWGKEDKAVLEESITAIKNESDFMTELVEKLLFLASADKKGQALQKAPFALAELVDEVLKETRLIDAEHTITGDINEKIMVNGDRSLIKQALRVFLDNSIKYTPIPGSIKLNSRSMGGKALITIEDTGMGIPKDDLPYIFNRFYKSDKARTRENGGAGLGLSIAKLIIEKHLGKIQVESNPGQGTKVSITLPSI